MKPIALFSLLAFYSAGSTAVTIAPVTPFWLDQADAYVHYTFDAAYTIDAPLNSTLESSWGDSSLTTLARFDTYSRLRRDYNLTLYGDANPGYDPVNPGVNEQVYLWLDFTYFYSGSGGLSFPNAAGLNLTNDEGFLELDVDANLSLDGGNLDHHSVSADGGTYGHYSIMWQIRQLPTGYADNGWPEQFDFFWGAYGDSWHLTDVHAATISYQNYVPSAVPVPAAVWLFGSGLVGVISVARRRKI
ncbi:MAG: VPLPA-CTERM sorting domain-containing protein [Gammaproteobacteria bacterium]|nr:VPLPA-CTERM sorting domain-containing protein [Gammaproteobacteria bacterium]